MQCMDGLRGGVCAQCTDGLHGQVCMECMGDPH